MESYPWQDRRVLDFLQRKIEFTQLIPVERLLNDKLKVGKNDAIYCSRFHIHYLFARSDVSGYYFQDTEYYDIKHQSIVDKGSSLKELSLLHFNRPIVQSSPSYISLQDKNFCQQKRDYLKWIFRE